MKLINKVTNKTLYTVLGGENLTLTAEKDRGHS